MNKILILFFTILSFSVWGQDSSIPQLKEQLEEATTSKEKMILNYQLAEAYLRVDKDEALKYGKKAQSTAINIKDYGMAARASYAIAKAYERKKDKRNQEVWLKSTLNYAKQANYADLIMQSVSDRSKLAVKDRNYRRAYEINQEAFKYFSQKGTSISDLDSRLELQRAQMEKDRRALQKEMDKLEFQIRNLSSESQRLATDKTALEAKQAELIQSNQSKTNELTTKEEELANIAEEKEKAEQLVQKKEKEVKALTRDALEQENIKQALEIQAKEAKELALQSELAAKKNENIRNVTLALAGLVLLLMLLVYSRYRSKKKAANLLSEKNMLIEEEKERSDELLLNILPGAIAKELKETGKAKAQKFSEVSVLFTDFRNFTKIAEMLSPEELVEELDKAFKAFDFIISQYNDIEKIKTIGDAYMCASGLTEGKTLPNNMIKAALEMQEYLAGHKKERIRLGKPYFEARIGIHTGPAVAGVVGFKKFAYDIWGDTVNTAARIEANCEPGKVNISESTYSLVKYSFDCEYRGKVEAKNKGQIEMYYVNKENQST